MDCDVLVQQNTLSQIVDHFIKNKQVVAIFGSYDDTPPEKNFSSQYKNLLHHFIHQHSPSQAETFWGGCGAIRRDIFEKIGQFNTQKYPRNSSIHDIELGYRLRSQGYQILLDKNLQVKHLKHWTLTTLLYTDIFYRAMPWSRLILETGKMVNTLNLHFSYRMSAFLVGLSVLFLLFSTRYPILSFFTLALLVTVFFLNFSLFKFFFHQRGVKFAILSFLMHLTYYFYSGVTFLLCWCWYVLENRSRMTNLVKINGRAIFNAR